jgi:biotin carboxylase
MSFPGCEERLLTHPGRYTAGARFLLLVHFKNENKITHFRALSEYCADRGWQFLLLMSDPTWESDFADHVIEVDTSNVESALQAVQSWCDGAENQIDGVLTLTEHAVPLAAAVAARWGLPHISPEVARVSRDKFAMRTVLKEAGVAQPDFGLARTDAEAAAVAERIGFPVVVKPLIGAGSMYVQRVDSRAELCAHFESLRRDSWVDLTSDPLCSDLYQEYDGALLVEEYVDGHELSCEALSANGDVIPVAMHSKPLAMKGPYFPEYYYRTPADLPEATAIEVRETVRAAIAALGITLGATHTELRLTAEGIRILEVGARLGGMSVYQSVKTSIGIDMVTALAALAMGERLDLTMSTERRHAGFCHFFSEHAGVVTDVIGVEEARGIPGVLEISVYCAPGGRVAVPPVSQQGIGHAFFTAASAEELDRIYVTLQELVRVRVQVDEGLYS